MGWKSLDDMELNGKRVLLRVDINVPVENGKVTDATRIERIAPTVADILAKGGLPILIAHFGRPKGQVVSELSLGVCLAELEATFGQPLAFMRFVCAKMRFCGKSASVSKRAKNCTAFLKSLSLRYTSDKRAKACSVNSFRSFSIT